MVLILTPVEFPALFCNCLLRTRNMLCDTISMEKILSRREIIMANIFQRLIPYQSPLELLLEHSKLCVDAAKIMREAVSDYLDGGSVDETSAKIDELEDEADHIKLKVREIYNKLKWTYFSRVDFLELLHYMDSIIDATDDVLKMLTMNVVEDITEEIKADIRELTILVAEGVEHMYESVEKLKLIAESAFAPQEVQKEDERVHVVEKEENSSDTLGIEIGKKLFKRKREMNPVDIIFLNNVVILLTSIEDKAKNVVEKVRMIIHA